MEMLIPAWEKISLDRSGHASHLRGATPSSGQWVTVMQFDLICEYVHCKGTKREIVGIAESEESARQWVREQQLLAEKGESPFRYEDFECPATLCAMKDSPPSFSYSEHRTD